VDDWCGFGCGFGCLLVVVTATIPLRNDNQPLLLLILGLGVGIRGECRIRNAVDNDDDVVKARIRRNDFVPMMHDDEIIII